MIILWKCKYTIINSYFWLNSIQIIFIEVKNSRMLPTKLILEGKEHKTANH